MFQLVMTRDCGHSYTYWFSPRDVLQLVPLQYLKRQCVCMTGNPERDGGK